MNWDYLVALMPALLALILVSAGIEDVRLRTIANWKNALIALLAVPWWWANGMSLWPDVAIQIGFAIVIFGFFVMAFALGQMGGGDVKLIGALALWFPVQSMIWLLIMMSLIGGGLTLAMMIDRWRRQDKAPLEIPYGVAIAIAALLAAQEPVFNQFT